MRSNLATGVVSGVLALVVTSAGGCGSAVLNKGSDGGGGTGGASAGGMTGSGGAATGAGGSLDSGHGDALSDTVDAGADTAVDALPTCAGTTCSVVFASDSSWPAYDGDPATNLSANKLGAAQPVCLNATSPPSCPTGALIYGHAGVGWAFSLASIPGAVWIWGPGIAVTDVPDLKQFYFSRTFNLGLGPTGTISISADDKARVVVNGVDVDGVGSTTDETQAGLSNTMLTTFDLSTALHPGTNTITIAAQNGPASFGGCTGSCTYATNPAGVVFGGTLSYH